MQSLDFLEEMGKDEEVGAGNSAEEEDTLAAGTEAAGYLDSAGFRTEAAVGFRDSAALIEALESLALLNAKLEVSCLSGLGMCHTFFDASCCFVKFLPF